MSSIQVEENKQLAPYTTFRVGGPARYFTIVKSLGELGQALDFAAEHQQPLFVLAGGSNLIISEQGFNGLVIKVELNGCKISGNSLTSGCCTSMATLVDESIKAGLAGLEWAGGLPGSFGGAIRGNAGCFGAEIKDVISSIKCLNTQTREIRTRDSSQAEFGYRESYYKKHPEEIILSATLQLHPGDSAKLRQIADSHTQYRRDKHPIEYPCAGSIFKNTPVENIPSQVIAQFQSVIKSDPFPVVPTAKIIADTSLSGLTVGQAQLSTKHTNYIVNLGTATGEQIVELIHQIQQKVRDRFGIELEVEPELVGFSSK